MDVVPLNACKAVEIARSISRPALFLLVETYRMQKQRPSGYFPLQSLNKPSKRKPLEVAKSSFDSALKELRQSRLIEGTNPIRVATIAKGVEHAFWDLRDSERLKAGVSTSEWRSVAFMDRVVEAMERACAASSR